MMFVVATTSELVVSDGSAPATIVLTKIYAYLEVHRSGNTVAWQFLSLISSSTNRNLFVWFLVYVRVFGS